MKGKHFAIWLCVLLATLILASFSYAGDIVGTITEVGTGLPAAGVTAKLNTGPSTNTLADGSYSFTGLAAATYTVTVSSPDYYAKAVSVAVTATGTAVCNIQIVKIPTNGTPVVDTFTGRPDGTDLGSTEGANAYPWVLGQGENLTSISGEKLLLAASTNFLGGLSVGGDFKPADFDMTVDMSVIGGNWGGIIYRQTVPGTYDNIKNLQTQGQAGYLLLFTPGSVVTLYRWGQVKSQVTLPSALDWSQPHTVRVQVVGGWHKVWVDGTKVMEVLNAEKLSGGYVGVYRYGSEARFDNFNILPITTPTGTVTGRVYNAADPSVSIANAKVTASSGQSAITDANGKYSLTCNANGFVTLTAVHEDYYANSVANVQPVPGQNISQDIPMTTLPTPLEVDIATDSFTRDDNLALGNTEDPNHYPWALSLSEGSASVSGGELVLAQNGFGSGVSVGGTFLPADFELEVNMRIATPDAWGAISYRQTLPGTYDNRHQQTQAQAGYMVYFTADGTKAVLYKWGTNLVVADLTKGNTVSPVDWTTAHKVRVRVVGPYHRVWIDNEKIIDAVHSAKLTGGYTALVRHLSEVHFDNLKISRYATDAGQISGTVYDATDPNKRVAGAKIRLSSGHTTTTDINGQYSFSRLPIAYYAITPIADGYYTKTAATTLTAAQPTALIDFSLVAIPETPTQTVFDNFDRADGEDLGSTSTGNIPWNKAGETAEATISNNMLSLSTLYAHGVSLSSDFLPADVDMSVNMIAMGDSASWGGVIYRQSLPGVYDTFGGQDPSKAGYLVLFSSDGKNVTLWRNGSLVSTQLATPIEWFAMPRIRVRAIGARHEVFVDRAMGNGYEKVIDHVDGSKLTGGYAGISRHNASIFANDLNIDVYAPPTGIITGTITDAADPTIKLAGALVQLYNGQVITADNQGVYSASVPATAPASLTAWAPGYRYATQTNIEVMPNGTVTRDIALQKLTGGNTVLYDTFSRADSTTLGTTEDPSHATWAKTSGETAASISGGQLLLSTLSGGWGVGPGSYRPHDFELTVDATCSTTAASSWIGISYRQNIAGDFNNGYMFVWTADGKLAYLYVPGGTSTGLINFSPAIDWSVPHKLKVKVEGPNHQLWIDGVKVIDVLHWGKLTNGYFGFCRWDAEAHFDNLFVVGGGALASTPASSIADAKTNTNGTMVEMGDSVSPIVTAVFSDCFYIEDKDRTSGIKVMSSKAVEVGDAVTVRGVLGRSNTERLITAIDVTVNSSDNELKPLGMSNKSNAPADGLSNVGLLTTIWGKVTAVSEDQSYCYVDDGSGLSNEPDTLGVKVIIAGAKKPAVGKIVTCTGIARMTAGPVPIIQMRSDSDLVIAD